MTTRALAVGVLAMFVGCGGEPALLRQMKKVGLVNNIQHELLESVDAEKSAVLATTDEESKKFAEESRQSSAKINDLRANLAELIEIDPVRDEREKLAAFDDKWKELEAIDTRLLQLAVANTNLKAARLLAHEGSTTLDRFIAAADTMMASTDDIAAIRALSTASTAFARIQSLLFAHIPEKSDAEMTALEGRIRTLGETVDAQLKASTGSLPASSAKADATQAWADYQRTEAEVIRLSRENSNVISFDVSTHEKRTATQACLDALAGLRDSIQGGPHATR
jgi:chemoreceptor-like protein with four helix bundle sensory module